MESPEAKLSIVIPTYNRPEMLDRLLASISRQSYKYFEVIVVDDNSISQESYILTIKKYVEYGLALKYFSNSKNMGAPYSRNLGISESKGEWIALVDDDDEWKVNKVFNQLEVIKNAATHLGIIYSWTDAVYRGEVVHEYRPDINGYCKKQIITECFIPSPSVVVRRSAIRAVEGFDEKLPSCQDWDAWTRIVFYGYSVAVVKSNDVIYHKHDSDTIGNSSKSSFGYLLYFRKHWFKLLIYRPRLLVRWFKFELFFLFRMIARLG